MRLLASICIAAVLIILTGCQQAQKPGVTGKGEKVLLLVNFKPDKPLKYKFVSERNFQVNLDENNPKASGGKLAEKLEMVISYQAVGEPDEEFVTTVKATCGSVKVTRKGKFSERGPDPVESLAGKSYTFKIDSVGNIVDFTEINELARQLGEKAISDAGVQGRIKKPDMIADFLSLQLFFWDAVSSAPQGIDGISPGQSWTSKQYFPLPVPIRFTRQTTYTLAEPETSADQDDNKLIIKSDYGIGEGQVENWPKIYSGSFQMRGTFGFLRNFRLRSLEGTGRQVFNLDRGVIESASENYKIKLGASLLISLKGVSPVVDLDQRISAELIE